MSKEELAWVPEYFLADSSSLKDTRGADRARVTDQENEKPTLMYLVTVIPLTCSPVIFGR